jgi:hypothetical protein
MHTLSSERIKKRKKKVTLYAVYANDFNYFFFINNESNELFSVYKQEL